MILYILFVLILLLMLLTINGSRKQQLKVVFGLCLLMFLLTGTRWEYGGDWDNYYFYFNESTTTKISDWVFELGYSFISYVIKSIFDSFVVLQFVMAGIIFYASYKSIKEISVIPVLSYFVFFAMEHGGINYVRTTIATCIAIYSYIFVVKKQLIPFLLIVIFASSIHFSAFVTLPVYWAYHNRIKYKIYLIGGLICCGVFYVSGKFILSDFSILGPYVQAKLDRYIMAEEIGENFGSTWTVEDALLNHVIKKVVLFFFIFYYCKKTLEKDIVFRGLTNIYVVSTIYYCSVVPIAMQFARTSGYMDGVELFLYSYVYKSVPNNRIRLTFLIIAIAMNIVRIKGHIEPDNPLIYNYHNILTY